MPKYPTNKSSSFTQDIETYTSYSHVTPHKLCANMLVLEQIKHVNSQLSKVSNKLKYPTSNHVFKILSLLMKIKSQFLDKQKFQDKHEHVFFFFFSKKKSGTKCV
jgi:hypothetical protein